MIEVFGFVFGMVFGAAGVYMLCRVSTRVRSFVSGRPC